MHIFIAQKTFYKNKKQKYFWIFSKILNKVCVKIIHFYINNY